MNTHENFRRDEPIHGSSDRSFGLVFAAFFALVAVLPLWSGRPVRWWAVPLSAAFLLLALIVPKVLKPLNAVWMRLGLLLNKITSPVALGLLFYVVFTPFGLVMRLLGRDALRLKFDTKAATYWIARQPPGPPPNSMANQF